MNKEIIQILIGQNFMLIKGGMYMANRNRGEGTIYYSEARKQWIG